ncbi:preprotein translocase subunit SecE [Oceanidesulfovibrio indonesiensis]|uniref:Protein translocase subunit SecE n=1 Tax=Oceanidesulfovibrio indonesiensis TaxID=54767 RepID=A0A7M3MHF4_9BACT|nr:preprotein translocase subunit SecE [Oceanidesulfovibrio indonesiensis]TVM18931.1 preprotein translocase subunit SecE [Oceanidesulfovibrio indonesiensis]
MANKNAKGGRPADKGAKAPRNGTTTGRSGKEQGRQAKGQATTAPKGPAGKLHQLRDFFEESKGELKKVTWPSRKETVATSIAVVVLVLVMSAFLWGIDLVFSKVVQLILS